MQQAQARSETLRNAFRETPAKRNLAGWDDFADALEEDFDTPRALAVLHDWASKRQLDLMKEGLAIFGLSELTNPDPAPPEIIELAEQRSEARTRDDFETADRIRDELEAAGWIMRDSARGYQLVRKRT
jgi:cysteinyl-tRNA synthetase